MVVPVNRGGQFFIITAVLIAGALLSTTTLIASSQTVDYSSVLERHETAYMSNAASELRNAWWNISWSTRKTVVVEERSGAFLDNESVSITVDALPSRVQDDCDDIRIVHDDGQRPWVNATACEIDIYRSEIDGVARYLFDNNTQGIAYDVTGHGHHGSHSGNPRAVSGRFDAGLSMDPDDAVEVPDSDALDFTGDGFTISFWLRPRSTPDGNWRQLFVKGDGTSNGGRNYAMWLRPNENTVHFRVDPNNQGISATATELAPGQWYHIAGVYDPGSNELRFYLDGELDGSESGVTMDSDSDNDGDLYIGQSPNFQSAEMVVDDFRIYNRTLPVEKIEGIARNGIGIDMGVDLAPRQQEAFHVYYNNPAANAPGYDGSAIQTTALNDRPTASVGAARSIDEVMKKMQENVERLDRAIGANLQLILRHGCNRLELVTPRISLHDEIC